MQLSKQVLLRLVVVSVWAGLACACSDSGSSRPDDVPQADSADAAGGDAQQDTGADSTGADSTDSLDGDTTGHGADGEADAGSDVDQPSAYEGLVVITEFLVDPTAVLDTDGEWVELHNVSDSEINLKGWSLRDDGSDLHVIASDLRIEAGGYALLAASGDPGLNGGLGAVDYVYPAFEFLLGNTNDEVVIEAPDGMVDRVAYASASDGWPVAAGHAFALKDTALADTALAAAANDLPASWCAAPLPYGAGDFGSPGAVNPACDAEPELDCTDDIDNDGDGLTDCADPDCVGLPVCSPIKPGDLVVSEIFADPDLVADSEGEWFEVFNASGDAIDLRGLELSDNTGQLHLVEAAEPLWVGEGEFFVFASAAGALGSDASPGYVWGEGYSLGNTNDSITLRYGAVLVDTVAWSSALGFPLAPGVSMSLSGASLEAALNDLGSNWCLAVSPFGTTELGTPGAANPICVPPGCGNGKPDPGESCDDGNDIPGDGCEPDCTATPGTCGDGQPDEGEECDDGNQLSGDGCSKKCLIEVAPAVGAVVFAELMINPDVVADAVGEWIEVYNPGPEPVDLAGWTLFDNTTDEHVIAPAGGSLEVAPGGYVVLGRNADLALNGGVDVDYAYGASLNLTNTADQVGLRFAGQQVDLVAYAVPVWTVPKGASLSLDPGTLDSGPLAATANDLPGAWCPAPVQTPAPGGDPADAGTPGAVNLPCFAVPECGNTILEPGEDCDDGNLEPGDGCEPDCTVTPAECGNDLLEDGEQCDDGNLEPDDGCEPDCTITPKSYPVGSLIVTEVMANPNAAPDSSGEWLELYNTSNETIDLANWRLADAGADNHTIPYDAAVLVGAGEHVVIGNGGPGSNGGILTVYVYTGFGLSNSSDSIRLFGPDGVLIDQVDYGFVGAFQPEAGVSARLDPEAYSALGNDHPDSWCASVEPIGNGDFGSPGKLNLSCNLAAGCGDSICKPTENCAVCPIDCGACDMCEITAQPGCGGCECEECVCAQDASCCEVAWDAACVTACQNDCGGPNCESNGCTTSAVPGCADCPCQTCVCDADPACCELGWDDQCATLCEACGQDCEAEQGCAVTGEPGCDGCACENCVCAQDPSCCTTAWDVQCVALCDGCGGDCLSHGCDASPLPGCNGCACAACVCTADPFCCTTAWGPECVTACQACGQDCGSNGCSVSDLPGCTGCSCEVCVCAADPFCCTDAWDADCAAACASCGEDCPEPTCGNGFVEGDEECDAGVLNSDTKANACRSDCMKAHCGDGVLDTGEACDDGNEALDDGCTPGCLVEVGVPQVGDLVISEIMYNPAVVFDLQGEWFEVYNASPKQLDITGLQVSDTAGGGFTVLGTPQFLVDPGAYVVFGSTKNSAVNGGYTPDYVYANTFVLDNSGQESLTLKLGGVVIDAVVFGAAGFPKATGASLSLSSAALDAASNDVGSAWCLATVAYGQGDLGTPGEANGPCADCGDGACAGGEDCATCEADCGACTDGCDDSISAGCSGCDCEECVCAIDASCCNLLWDSFCVGLCQVDCGGCPDTCGDGVEDPGEDCDDGLLNSDTVADACRTNCEEASCGDGVQDSGEECDDGNKLSGDGCSAACILTAATVKIGDLVITEVMSNPGVVSDALGEWVELYNAAAVPLNLNGFAILDATNEFHLINKDVIVVPGDYVVLGNNDNMATNGGAPVDYRYQGFSLSNATDQILIAYGGLILDIIIYDNGATFPDFEGRSMSLDGAFLDSVNNNAGSNWCAGSTPYGLGDYGTPGAPNPSCVPAICGNSKVEAGEDCDDGDANSDTEPNACRSDCTDPSCGDNVIDDGEDCDDANIISGDGCEPNCEFTFLADCGNGTVEDDEECDDGNEIDDDRCNNDCIGQSLPLGTGAIVITEVMVDPKQVDDSVGEWVEVYNPGTEPVDLQYVLIENAFGGVSKILDPIVVAPGAFGVLAASSDPAVNGGISGAAQWTGSFSLTNGGPEGVVIHSIAGDLDAVYWLPEWPVGPGAAMNLDPMFFTTASNDVIITWCAAVAPYNALDRGTPGAPNTACAIPIECGNGFVQAGEECDDGNLEPDDGCSPDCDLEAAVPGLGQLAITEIFSDPLLVDDSLGEWIELTNVSDIALDVNGISLTNSTGFTHIVNTGGYAILQPGDRWVVGGSKDTAVNGGVPVDHAWGAFSLKNGGDLIAVQSSSGLVDVAGYSAWPLWPIRPGRAMQMRDTANPSVANDSAAGWCLADVPLGADAMGTPGQPNSLCPPLVQAAVGDLVVTEIHPAPTAGDAGEYFEITNSAAEAVDLRGLHITDGESELHIVTGDDPVWVGAGQAVVFGRSADGAVNGGLVVDYVYEGIDLDDAGDSILIAAPGTLFDDATYFFPGFPDVPGAALLLDAAFLDDPITADEPSSWCLGSLPYGDGDLGSPGEVNGPCAGD